MMHGYKQSLGKYGEEFACEFLKKKRYKILERNYKNKYGEIDIIASIKKTIVFVEVKTRFSSKYGNPYEAVGYYKQRRITNAAKSYLCKKGLFECDARFDVIEVYGAVTDGAFYADTINHIESAIENVEQF